MTSHKPYSIDPETGIKPISEWGASCGRGFVSDSRFGKTAPVIKRTNREISRKWRQEHQQQFQETKA